MLDFALRLTSGVCMSRDMRNSAGGLGLLSLLQPIHRGSWVSLALNTMAFLTRRVGGSLPWLCPM